MRIPTLPSTRPALALLAAALLVPAAAFAQAKKTGSDRTTRQISTECKITNTAPWVAKQNEWFADRDRKWTNDTLRTQLLEAAGLAAGPLVSPAQTGVEFEHQAFAETPAAKDMIKRLTALAAVRGAEWPSKSVVGAAGVHAVFLLAHRDTGFARAALHHMMEAGPAESPAADVATLEDRLRLYWGRKQIYGTQFIIDAKGNPVLAPMEDSAHADLRREDAGLPPLKLSICLAKYQK